MNGSKRRLRWAQVPAEVRAEIELVAGDRVIAARNCEDGFSPGLASLLRLADGRLVFAKAIDGRAWPGQEEVHRAEARVAAALPAEVPSPRFTGSYDDGRWVALVFEGVEGARPPDPADRADVDRATVALGALGRVMTPAPIMLPADHPRLGGWTTLATTRQAEDCERARLARLADHAAPADRRAAGLAAAWAADRLGLLRALERNGLAAARGSSLVHFDAYPHNILVTPEQVLLIDWPHARLGAPYLDLLAFMCSVAEAGSDPEPVLARHPLTADVPAGELDAVLAAQSGFLLCDCLDPAPPGLEPIIEKKISIGVGAIGWLARRLGDPL